MSFNLRREDIEALSAYLDGQLPAGQAAQLAARLNAEPELKAAYDALRETKAMLRHAPRLRAPRSFALTPEMAGRGAAAARAYPVLRWVSNVATALFVLVFAGNFLLTNRQFGLASAPEPEAGITIMQAATEAPLAADAVAEGALEQEAPPPEAATESAAAELFAAGTAEATEEMATAPATEELGAAELKSPTPQASPTIELGDERVADAGAGGDLPAEEPAPRVSPLQLLEAGLALVAVAAGAGALWVRRRGRG